MIALATELLIRVTVVMAIPMVIGWWLGRRRAALTHQLYGAALTGTRAPR